MKYTAKRLASTLGAFALVVTFITSCGAAQSTSQTIGDFKCGEKNLKVTVTVQQWESLIETLGGSCVEVSTVLSGTMASPHGYVGTPNDETYFKNADLIVANGAGYDEWAEDLIPAESRVITAATAAEQFMSSESLEAASPYNAVDVEKNSHLWFSPAVIKQFANNITGSLNSLFPDDESRELFKNNKKMFDIQMKDLEDKIAKDRDNVISENATFASTESVADYLFTTLGYTNKTPEGYANAIKDGSDPSSDDVNDFLNMISSRDVSVLVVNTQEMTLTAENLQTAARLDGVRDVSVSEMVIDAPDLVAYLSKAVDYAAGREVLPASPANSASEECAGDPPVCTKLEHKLSDADKAMISDAFNPN